MTKLSHVDEKNRPTMVDVGDKAVTERRAHARTLVDFPAELSARFIDGDIQTAKGPVIATAIVAGVMGAKRTHELIPFCHPLGLDSCKISIEPNDQGQLQIDCHCKVHHRTGVEMEALTGASIAALAIYDMCKALSHDIAIRETMLISKTGGKKDFQRDRG
ncbi:MAG: cyclic pyranopterin monophosphate synthase MoaC [Gammaproteobacteria bacterium]|nr:cyclic pyranopterin monophosphate synthase MoaC [Gammaproteobacteria bacterium]